MVTRKLAPALAAGCTVVVKTAGETPFTANAVMQLGQRAGVPKGVVNIISALENTPEIGATLCQSEIVRKISFTGSTRVGKLLMQQSSQTLKKMSLELGGNAPFLVFEDADLDLAVAGVIASKFKSSGQTCVCANRVFVQVGIHKAFVSKLKEEMSKFKVGYGFDGEVTHGPLISAEAAQRVAGLVHDAVQGGGCVEIGGKARPDLGRFPDSDPNTKNGYSLRSPGLNFFEPTVITNLKPNMRILEEEIFGPVAPILSFKTEEEVVDAANRCDVGLASYIFTNDLNRATRVSELLQFGMVALNTGVISDAAAP